MIERPRSRPTWFRSGWMRDDAGAWHHFAMRVDDVVHPATPYWLIRFCDWQEGRKRSAPPRLLPAFEVTSERCAACDAEIARQAELPEWSPPLGPVRGIGPGPA